MPELIFRLSREGDVPALTKLWQAVFGDGEELIAAFFRLLWRPEYCRVAEAEGEVVSMGYCLPGPVARGLRCSYIYAMATAEAYRGRRAAQRIGRGLIADAFASGAQLVATLPAEESLCRWYEEKLGMSPLFRKTGPGVQFPPTWPQFSAICGPHSPTTSDFLYAIAAPGVDTSGLRDLGWECTFD